jgi:hypothetical protein
MCVIAMTGWLRVLSVLAIAALLAACGDGRTRPLQVRLTVANAAPSFPDISIYRGENRGTNASGLLGTLTFRTGGEYTFDADTYNFRLTVARPGGTQELARTFTDTLDADNRSIYVLTESGGALEELIGGSRYSLSPMPTRNSRSPMRARLQRPSTCTSRSRAPTF